MGMHVLTNEIHAELVGFPLEVTCEPDCGCGETEKCSACNVKSIVIDAGERDDGAVGSRLVIRGSLGQLREAFLAALSYLDRPLDNPVLHLSHRHNGPDEWVDQRGVEWTPKS